MLHWRQIPKVVVAVVIGWMAMVAKEKRKELTNLSLHLE
jgi:hypothetical protein